MRIQENFNGLAFENGYEIVRDGGLAIVGMSPGNSYFKKNQIDNLLKYCSTIFSSVRILIPSKPAEHNYLAMGYKQKKAERKARLKGNTLINHSRRTLNEILGDVKLFDWNDEFISNKFYQREFNKFKMWYADNVLFRTVVRETTKEVLKDKLKPWVNIDSAVNEGVYYLLNELAFLSASPKIFGVRRVTYVYHKKWEVYEQLIEGRFDGQKRSDLGLVIIK